MSGLPAIALLTADALGILSEFGPPQWGIFDQNGQPILVSDSVAGIEYSRRYDVSNYPQEQGAFETYNKVQIPYDAKVTLLTSLTRQQLLSTIEPVAFSLELVTVVMPEFAYESANITGYEFRRTVQNGVALIAVSITLKQIRFDTTTTQQQAPGGTDRPVGQVASSTSNTVGTTPGTSTTSAPFLVPGTDNVLNTGSTNAAYPTSSGPIQPLDASSATPFDLAAGTGAFSLPQIPPL